jgi:hypothetical protein
MASSHFLTLTLVLGIALSNGPHAKAQEATPNAAAYTAAFAGSWLVFDARYAGEKPCRIQLKAGEQPLQAITQDCLPALAEVKFWRIEAGQLQLLTASGPFARLGGTTGRVSGWDTAGRPLVLDRDTGNGAVDPVNFARQAKGCWFLGYSSQCATPAQALRPAASKARICTVVDLRLRAEARSESAVVKVLPAQTCTATEVCVTTANGPWCFIRFDAGTGWIRQHVLRHDEWPVLTFVAETG